MKKGVAGVTYIDSGRSDYKASTKLIEAAWAKIETLENKEEAKTQFAELLAHKAKPYTSGADKDDSIPPKYNKINLENLAEILELTGWTIPDFWKICYETPLPQLTPKDATGEEYKDRHKYIAADVSDVYRMCDALDDDMRQTLAEIATSMAPICLHTEYDDAFPADKYRKPAKDESKGMTKRIFDYEEEGSNVSKKVWWVCRRKYMEAITGKENYLSFENNAFEDNKEFLEKSRGRNLYLFSLEAVPDICASLGISFHSICDFPDHIFLYATKRYTETIVTYYMFMSENSKQTFFRMLQELTRKEH